MTQQELIDKTDSAIAELVYDKQKLQKAYNYYNGKRDKKQFQHLEENFGIGSPTSVQFTPLLRKHVDELVGEFLDIPILPKISCKDEQTISNINRDKQLEISTQVIRFLEEHLSNSILKIAQGQDITDKSIKQQIDRIVENINESFVSQYEETAQNVLRYIIQSRQTDLVTKLRQLFIDLLVTGYCFYRVKKSQGENNIDIEVLDPRNVFIDRNPESPYIRDSYQAVVRSWMTKSQILAKYGKELSASDIKKLKDDWKNDTEGRYYRSSSHVISVYDDEELEEDDIIPGKPYDDRGHLIADRFNGSGELENLVPMEGKLNKGDYAKLEDTLAEAVKDGADVRMKVEPVYSGYSNRPDEFRVSYTIDGDKEVVVVKNRSGE